MKKNISRSLALLAIVMAVVAFSSCNNRKFHISGTITEAKDSMLYLDHNGLDGYEAIDSVKLTDAGTFDFSESAPDAPEFYRLRIAGQYINLSVDSTETVEVTAQYPTMSTAYEVKGSDNCQKIKELALMQIDLQQKVNALVASPIMGVDSTTLAINALLAQYKDNVKRQYIFKEPMKAYSYYALFQTVTVNGQQSLIFNPRTNKDDVKVFAAVATSWDTYYPKAERGANLHNIAIEGMKNIRIIQNQQQEQMVDASKVNTSGCIDIALQDNRGRVRHLTDLKGKVVMLDFHLFASDQSMKRIMWMRNLYNKYHARGLEIYQVSVDPDEHFWKVQTEALPWICVRDDAGTGGQSLVSYNVQDIPTFFLIDRNNVLQKRDVQIKDLDAEISALLN